MNIIKEMEQIIKAFTFCDTTGANLASNAILDMLDKNNLDIVEKSEEIKP